MLWLVTSAPALRLVSHAGTPAQRGVAVAFRGMPASAHVLLSGTWIDVALEQPVSSETARVGDPWQGFVAEPVALLEGGAIPAGSRVLGVVAAVAPARPGAVATIELGVESIRVDGHDELVPARTDSPGAQPVQRWAHQFQLRGGYRRVRVSSAPLAGEATVAPAAADARSARAAGVVRIPPGAVLRFRVLKTVAMR